MKSNELYKALKKASEKFEEALGFPDTEPMRESLIQRFEYTFELSWKLMSSILADEGMKTTGVRNIIRAAAKLELLDAPPKWFEFAEARNMSSHIYKEEVAVQVARKAKDGFLKEVQRLLEQCSAYAR